MEPCILLSMSGPQSWTQEIKQGYRKVDDAFKILLTANSGERRLTMKSRLFVSVPSDFGNRDKGSLTLR